MSGVFSRPLKSARTYVDSKEESAIVRKFVDQEYTFDHWNGVARRAKELCEVGIENRSQDNGGAIEAKVEYRAKTKKSLLQKLKMREEEMTRKGGPGYRDVDQIWDEIVDLAGVRIILYMPSEDQREKVKKVIQSIWDNGVEVIKHDGIRTKPADGELGGSKGYRPIHLGYRAEHYRASMNSSHSFGDYHWWFRDKVEIQVTSAFGNAWAQAGHDVLYKTNAFGLATLQEQRMLDAVNGIALSGDLLLEQFYELFRQRTTKPFETIHDLGIFLDQVDVLRDVEGLKFGEDLGLLLRFLKAEKKNSPLELRNAIKELGFPNEPELESITEEFYPEFMPKTDWLATTCLIHRTISKLPYKDPDDQVSSIQKCQIIVQALHMLLEFSHEPDAASKYLGEMFRERFMTAAERDSIKYILTNPYIYNILKCDDATSTASEKAGGSTEEPQVDHHKELETAWNWFHNRAKKQECVCSLVFRLALMGAVQKTSPLKSWQDFGKGNWTF